MIYVKYGHGKQVLKDHDPFNPINQVKRLAKYVFEQYSHSAGYM